jgi:hypothetical protein
VYTFPASSRRSSRTSADPVQLTVLEIISLAAPAGLIVTMSEQPKLEQCVEETEEGSRISQLVLRSKTPAMISEGLTVEAGLLLASSHSRPSASPNQTASTLSINHAPNIEGQDKLGKEGTDLELRTKRDSRQVSVEATADTSAVEGGTGKTGHSTRTKRKHKTVARKRQPGELRCVNGNLLRVCGE